MSAPTDPTVMLLRSFCLATMAGQYEEVMQRAEKDGWSHRQVLRHLCESEAVERAQKRTARLLSESGLPETKTLSTLDEALLPAKVRRQLAGLIDVRTEARELGGVTVRTGSGQLLVGLNDVSRQVGHIRPP
jgi:DNA replication protein DnaC